MVKVLKETAPYFHLSGDGFYSLNVVATITSPEKSNNFYVESTFHQMKELLQLWNTILQSFLKIITECIEVEEILFHKKKNNFV